MQSGPLFTLARFSASVCSVRRRSASIMFVPEDLHGTGHCANFILASDAGGTILTFPFASSVIASVMRTMGREIERATNAPRTQRIG